MNWISFIFADILYKGDTIRVFNVHLHSMKLRVNEIVAEKNEDKKLVKIKETIRRMKEGFIAHSREATILKSFIEDSPHPLILVGDFNDIPYSYTYLTFKDFLQNSFEEAGEGLGFTYNEYPTFIRIDNQFSSEEFNVISHQVHDEIKYSDHFPVSVVYELDGEDEQQSEQEGSILLLEENK